MKETLYATYLYRHTRAEHICKYVRLVYACRVVLPRIQINITYEAKWYLHILWSKLINSSGDDKQYMVPNFGVAIDKDFRGERNKKGIYQPIQDTNR